MAVSCAKGHVNDDANRFCDQCGLPLQAAPAGVPQEVTFVSMPAAGTSSVVCPVCGQENVPGTAFCDNCGAVLPPPQPAVDQPDAAGAPSAAQAQPDAVSVVCPNCGTANDALNRFCENCGATLASAEAASAPPAAMSSPAEGVTIVEDHSATVAEEQAAPAVTDGDAQPLDTAPPMAAQGDSAPAPDVAGDAQASTEQPLVDTVPQPGAETGSVAVDSVAPEVPTAEVPTAEVPAAEVAPQAQAPAAPAVDHDAERARLEGEIETQRRLVEQLEGMEQTFGAATPPAIKQGLDEARAALARAEQELEQLAPPAPPVDPAEVARLEGEIETQRRLVEQLEGMEQTFGAATPPAIKQGLDEARAALSRAEQELADLTGTPIVPAAPAAAVDDAADVPAPVAEAQPAEFAPPAVETPAPDAAMAQPEPESAVGAAEVAAAVPEVAAAVPEVAAPVAPAQAPVTVSGSRFVDRDGKVFALPSGKSELVIGREDPVSGIHPDIDLTPHGGEAGGVSRRHAVLREQGGQWTITDLDSTNYTRVDGSRIAPNTPTPLPDGARVQFGRVEFEFRAQ